MKRMVWKRWAPPLVVLALFLLLVVRLNQVGKVALVSREGQTFEKGVVTEILQDNVQPDGSRVGEQVVRVLMKTGGLKGREIETTSSSGFLFGAPCTVGMKVVVMAGVAASLFSLATGITGWNVSDIESLMTLWSTADIQVGGLLFSGLLISSLGATMDVAMSIASSMAEVQAQTPDISCRALFQAGMRVGRDMMGTDSNTLILAFAGGSVSMLVLDYAYDLSWLQIINSNNIGIAVMQGLAGRFGVVLSVPVTVALAMLLYVRPDRETPALQEQEQA